MIARGFKPVGWVAAVATAALGCYMLSLNVAAERAELAGIERQIILAKRDIRSLQTELGTRGRLQQLEHWNADVLALSAPASGQFLRDEFTLAHYSPTEPTFEESAKVQMASAAAPAVPTQPRMAVASNFEDDAGAEIGKPLVRQASMTALEPAPIRKLAQDLPKAAPITAAAPKTKAAAPKTIAAAPKTMLVKAGAARPLAAKPPVKKAALIDDGLARTIAEAANAETKSGGAAGR